MTVDVEGLRRTIRNIEEQMKHLGEEVVRLRRIADAAEAQSANGVGLPAAGLDLPREIVVPHPDAVAEYLQVHPDTRDLVRDLGAALVEEFKHESSSFILTAVADDYIDETDLMFTVRVTSYDDSLMDRIHRVEERFDDQLSHTTGNVYVTTDHIPAA